MELNPQAKSRIWWRGAFSNAFAGIPQGILLGVLGYALLVTTVFAIAAFFPAVGLGLAQSFGPFLFGGAGVSALAAGTMPAFSLAILNPLPVVALNAVLTVAGNFLTGGKIAIGDYQQKIDHAENVARIIKLEARQHTMHRELVNQAIDIESQGIDGKWAKRVHSERAPIGELTRTPQTSFAEAEEARAENPASKTLN